MVNAKKELLCDCCGTSNEPGKILSSKKAFFGNKLSDVLHAITQRHIPPTLAIKVCFICFFKFVQCERTIQEIREFVDRKKSGNAEEEDGFEAEDEEVQKIKQKPMKKRSFSVPGLGTLDPTMTTTATKIVAPKPKRSTGKTAAPVAEANDNNDILLDESVALLPGKPAIDKKNTSVLGVFGIAADSPVDSEVEVEVEVEAESESEEKGLIPETFECKRCDFKVKYPKKMKQHYMEVHGQQRPRIYFCPMCKKSFGVAKTLKEHAKTVHGLEQGKESGAGSAKTVEKEVPAVKKSKKAEVEVVMEKEVENEAAAEDDDEEDIEVIEGEDVEVIEAKSSSPRKQTPIKPQTPLKHKSPQKLQTPVKSVENKDEPETPGLSVIRALNEHKKRKDVTNTEYTFAINGSSASTPKPNGEPMPPSNVALICSICETEQPSVKTMQRHMSESHGIEKPKIFKCHKCEKSLASKQSLNYHLSWHLTNPDAEVTTKRKILHEEGPPLKRIESVTTKEVEDDTNDVADGPSSSSPLNKRKKLSVTSNVLAVSSPVKKSKKLSATANDVAVPSPKKSQKEPTVSLVSDEEKWVLPRPKKTKKEKKSSEAESVNISNINEHNESQAYPLDDMSEVNHKVQPHKREMLTSTCESTTADESEFNCSQCPKSVKSQRRLESHIAKMHGKSLKCSHCFKKFNTRQSYVVHFGECEGSDDNPGLPCGVRKCTKIFQAVQYLEEHLKKRHHW